MNCCGIDLAGVPSYLCVTDGRGKKLAAGEVATDKVAFARRLKRFVRGGLSIAIEAGNYPHSVAISDLDGDHVLDLAVVNFLSANVLVLLSQRPGACEGDANGDNLIDPLETGFVLARFGCQVGEGDPGCDLADQNGDGLVDLLDVGFVLARFGTCVP